MQMEIFACDRVVRGEDLHGEITFVGRRFGLERFVRVTSMPNCKNHRWKWARTSSFVPNVQEFDSVET